MKKVVEVIPEKIETVDTYEAAESTGIVAYRTGERSNPSEGWAVLSKYPYVDSGTRWGFFSLKHGSIGTCPVYERGTKEEAIRAAAKYRDVYVFDNYREFIKHIAREV